MVIPVILSGGTGSRLWPLSRELYPKQLLPLVGSSSLLQQTINRVSHFSKSQSPIIVCNEQHRFLVAEQLKQINVDPEAILLEPFGRNTAPAITLAALYAVSKGSDPILLVLPADHLLNDTQIFHKALQVAVDYAEKDFLVTFGIKPKKNETAYGYIQCGEPLSQDSSAFKVNRFVEKPDAETAKAYCEAGNYYWNSGMFVFRASQYLQEIERFSPQIFQICHDAIKQSMNDFDFIKIDPSIFKNCPSDSIDYCVMEKTQNAVIVPLDAEWSDVGSWSALWDVGNQDSVGNVLQGDVMVESVKNSYIHSNNRMCAVVGLSDCVVMETADAVLVAHKDSAQDVKKIVERLKETGRVEAEMHKKVYRPWGFYESIDESDRYKVKRITVNTGASLSLQVHHHRSEHWVVVKGTAQVTRGEETFLLSENQSTYIPVGTQHRLANHGKIPLEIIEVQSGSYLGEDDIVRFDDVYGRS